MTGESVEETIRRAMDYFTELYEESDRGAAILAAATFEHWLESNIIENFVELDQDMRNNLFDNGPLSTFSAKINLGFALGLYNKTVLNDLHTVRRIRNKFAHSTGPMNFKDQPISDLCRNLDKGNTSDSEDPRTKYLNHIRWVQGTIVRDHFDGKPQRRRNREDST